MPDYKGIMQNPTKPAAAAAVAATITSLTKCTPKSTRTVPNSTPAAKRHTPSAGEKQKAVNAIIKTENVCRDGILLPFVVLPFTGFIRVLFSYGRGRFIKYLTALKTQNAINGTEIARR